MRLPKEGLPPTILNPSGPMFNVISARKCLLERAVGLRAEKATSERTPNRDKALSPG